METKRFASRVRRGRLRWIPQWRSSCSTSRVSRWPRARTAASPGPSWPASPRSVGPRPGAERRFRSTHTTRCHARRRRTNEPGNTKTNMECRLTAPPPCVDLQHRLHGRVVKGVGHRSHDEATEAGGREFEPRLRHWPTGTVFLSECPVLSKF